MRGETVWRDEKKNTQRAAQIFVRRPIFKGLLKKCPNECRPMIIERSIAPTRRVEVGVKPGPCYAPERALGAVSIRSI